jgi:hypothetical protein
VEITKIVCGAVADRISNSFYSHLYKISGDDTVFEVFKLSYILPTRHIETVIFNMVNEYSFKGT